MISDIEIHAKIEMTRADLVTNFVCFCFSIYYHTTCTIKKFTHSVGNLIYFGFFLLKTITNIIYAFNTVLSLMRVRGVAFSSLKKEKNIFIMVQQNRFAAQMVRQ